MGRLIDADILIAELKESAFHHCNNSREDSLLQRDRVIVRAQPTVEAIPKANVYKAVREMMKYEHEGFINISLARLDEILKKCGVSEDGNDD